MTYYCGATNDLEKRLKTHNDRKGAKYTVSRTPVRYVWNSLPMNKSMALRQEHVIKKMQADDKRIFINGGHFCRFYGPHEYHFFALPSIAPTFGYIKVLYPNYFSAKYAIKMLLGYMTEAVRSKEMKTSINKIIWVDDDLGCPVLMVPWDVFLHLVRIKRPQ